MNIDNYVTVFDIMQVKKISIFSYDLIIPIISFIAILIPSRILDKLGPSWLPRGLTGFPGKVLVSLVFLGSTAALVTATSSNNRQLEELQAGERKNQLVFTEGCLQAFHPMPFNGHENERIAVGNHTFEYSDYGGPVGFNNTESHGGPIHADSAVKIWYSDTGAIAKLSVRSHACPVAPDFAK